VTVEIGLSVEGQEGVSWPQWVEIARVAEEHGFAALYRSDHYLSEHPGTDRDSLDAWGTICGLSALTSRIRLGTLVSPVTFRHPSVLAKLAVTADHISRGRVDVGIGAGWYAEEHTAYGFEMPDLRVRLEMLEEQVEILAKSWAEGPFTFRGRHYRLENNDAKPKPTGSRLRLIVGGGGGRRSLDLAAQWADEYNIAACAPEQINEHRQAMTEACLRWGRDPTTLELSILVGVLCGQDQSELEDRAVRVRGFLGHAPSSTSAASLDELPRDWIVGTPAEVSRRLSGFVALGVKRIMLGPPLHDDLEMVSLIGREVLPAVAAPSVRELG
jgi:F420-dependent oxidoreductase-like protein